MPDRTSRTAVSHQRGQVLPLFVVFLTVLLGLAALVIDMGHWWVLKRDAQNDADAIALAAVTALPRGEIAAREVADDFHNRNAPEMSYTIRRETGTETPYVLEATVTTDAETSFARLFGIDTIDVEAKATASLGSYTAWAPRMLPWAIDEPSLEFGTPLTVKVRPGGQVSPGEFGAVDLIIDDPKRGCELASGANDYRNVITEAVPACAHRIGDEIEQEPGNMAMTGKAVADRGAVNGFDPSSILVPLGADRYSFTDEQHPNIGVIPVIDEWVNGNSEPIRIVQFAWFVITSYSKDEVSGVFVRVMAGSGASCPGMPSDACPIGDYDPDGIGAVHLTG
jgi:hypothetical protein